MHSIRPTPLLDTEPSALRPARKGRGARANPTGRFERARVEPDLDCLNEAIDEGLEESAPGPKTEAIPDPSRSAISFNRSPDIPFDASFNPYRGCEHGCAYCYARPTHEYLGYSAGLDFETKILVKHHAPELLRRELSALRWKPQVVAVSGVTDAYQPLERRLQLTRRCIEVFEEFRNPITVITKSALVTRDLDLFRRLAEYEAISVFLLGAAAGNREIVGGGNSDRRHGRADSSRANRVRNACDPWSRRLGGGELGRTYRLTTAPWPTGSLRRLASHPSPAAEEKSPEPPRLSPRRSAR